MRDAEPGAFAPDISVLDAMQAWGASQDDIDRVRVQIEAGVPAQAPEAFGVYAENLPIVEAFLCLRTQWQYAGMAGQRMGFLWAGVEAWIDRHARRRTRRALSRSLQIMEHAVLQADFEIRQKNED